jgi:hypothetical protein
VREEALQILNAAQWFGSDNRNTERRERLRLERRAMETAEVCGKCGRELGAGDPIWRVMLSHRCWTGTSHCLVPVCESCGKSHDQDPRYGFMPRQLCEYCGRVVVNRATPRQWQSEHVFCCERCKRRYFTKRAKEQRARARQDLRCEVCGEPFEAARSDAKYCSNACRQRAYRERKE